MTELNIAVVGAGIGGLAAALALAGQGHRITLYERRTGFGETGAGIQLSPNASRVLIRLGLGPALRRVATEPDRFVVRDMRDGRELGAMALGAHANERYGAPYWFVGRADLHEVLLDAVRGRDDVRLRVGRGLAGLSQDRAGVKLSFRTSDEAAEEVQADLAIGADGLWSQTRAALGDERMPVYSGFSACRATIPAEAVPAAGKDGGLWLGAGRHIVHYPIGNGRLVNVVAVERRPNPTESWSAPVETAAMAAAFARAARPLRDLVGAAESWSAWSLFDLPVKRIRAGRVALLGDAAHPALPFAAQGGALAIEDAAILSRALASRPAVPEALAVYERERKDRAARVQTAARGNARAYHASGVTALVRNLVMRRLGPEGMTARLDWLYGWNHAA